MQCATFLGFCGKCFAICLGDSSHLTLASSAVQYALEKPEYTCDRGKGRGSQLVKERWCENRIYAS